MAEQPKQKPSSPKKQLDNYARYSGMGLMMAAIMGGSAWGGWKLDQLCGNKKFPVFTLVLSLLGVFGAMYYFIKDFLKQPPKKK